MSYEEAQQEQFCGIHALNMLFQERKLVWFKDCPELLYRELLDPVDEANEQYKLARHRVQVAEAALGEKERELNLSTKDKKPIKKGKKPTELIQPYVDEVKAAKAEKGDALETLTNAAEEADAEADESGVLAPNVCYNMAHLCGNLIQMAENAGVSNIESSCTFEDLGYNGQLPYDVLAELITGQLNYDIVYAMPNDVEQFTTHLNHPACIGALVNFKHPELHRHYGAVVKYPGAEGIMWADSAAEPILTPTTVAEMEDNLKSMRAREELNLLLFVLAKGDSAPTVALERLQNKKGGTRRRVRRRLNKKRKTQRRSRNH